MPHVVEFSSRLINSTNAMLSPTLNAKGAVQLVSIRVKISNQTIRSPDDKQGLELPAPVVAEFMRFIQDDETRETHLSRASPERSQLAAPRIFLHCRSTIKPIKYETLQQATATISG